MKVLSRVASPAGFALVLLLFFLLPFVSVSCDVPGMGEAGANYTGSHLVSGTEPTPTVPEEFRELTSDPSTPESLNEPPPDPGVQVLAIIIAALAAIGLFTALIPQLKARLLGGATIAAATLLMTIITMIIAQSNLQTTLLDSARRTGAAETEAAIPRMTTLVEEMVHTELGFWLVVVVLALLVIGTGGAGLLVSRPASAKAGGAELPGLPFDPPQDTAEEMDDTPSHHVGDAHAGRDTPPAGGQQ